MSNAKNELVLNTILIGIGNISTHFISFLLLPLYTSILSTSDYGVYDLILTISTFAIPIITLLMEESMFRFLVDCKNDEEIKKIISQTLIYVIGAIFLLSTIVLFINCITSIQYLTITYIYLISCILTSLRNSLLRGLSKVKEYTVINFITSVMQLTLNVVFIAYFHYGISGLLFSSIISNTITFAFIAVKMKLYSFLSLKQYDKSLMMSMIKYSYPLVPNSLAWTIINLSDRLVISSTIGTDANGIYSMAYKFPNLINTIYGYFYTAWQESSAKAINTDDKDDFFNDVYINLCNVMISISIGIIALMPLIFNIFIKGDFSEAYYYIPILVIAMYFNNISGYFGGIFSAHKNTKIMGLTTSLGAIINLIIDILLINHIGIYAAAISTLISCYFVYLYRKIKVEDYTKLKKSINLYDAAIGIISILLYYINSNFYIKIFNLACVCIYAYIKNRNTIFYFLKKLNLKQTNIK